MEGSQALLDTIVAQATPPGRGAMAVVRLSGRKALEIVSALAPRGREKGGRDADVGESRPVATALIPESIPEQEAKWPERNPRLMTLRWPPTEGEASGGEAIDCALVTFFRGPASYTGEDTVEISTHGGYVAPAEVVEACVALGARRARPGEFTQRAYLNGKLDLTQAEAVADLVDARSPKGRSVALHQLDRGLGERIAQLRKRVIGLSALLVQHIDFPEEDEAPVPLDDVTRVAKGVENEIANLLATAPVGELLREGALAVLAGRPNSGKSSLFNGLLGQERSIVTEEAGTTRDAIEAVVSIQGFPFRLVDTAGLREGAGQVEQMGIEVAQRYLDHADVVLFCKEMDGVEGSSANSSPEHQDQVNFLASLSAPVVVVRTKLDLSQTRQDEQSVGTAGARPSEESGPVQWVAEVPVSVVTGQGLDCLKKRLCELVFRGVVESRNEVPAVTSKRQETLLQQAHSEIKQFGKVLGNEVPPEVASAHLKAAETALEEVLGVVTTDDLLDRVFKDFCIGK